MGYGESIAQDLDTMDGLAFVTDREAYIRQVGATNWDAFAKQNGAPGLLAESVVNRSLFDFIEGKPVRDEFKKVLDRISQHPSWSWVLPFRCDAPDRERTLCQSLRPIFTGVHCTGFFFQTIQQHARARPSIPLFDFRAMRKLEQEDSTLQEVRMCSWCQRVQFGPLFREDWVSAEDYYAGGGRTNVRLNHTICDDCRNSTEAPFCLGKKPE